MTERLNGRLPVPPRIGPGLADRIQVVPNGVALEGSVVDNHDGFYLQMVQTDPPLAVDSAEVFIGGIRMSQMARFGPGQVEEK